MTDHEYALCIYRAVFKTPHAGDDANVEGIMSVIASLEEQEKTAFEGHYCYEKTFTQIAKELGAISPTKASKIVSKALMKLRHPSCQRAMSKEKAGQHDDSLRQQLARANDTINNLCEVVLASGMTAETKLLTIFEALEISLFNLPFMPQTANYLSRAGKSSVRAVYEISSYAELRDIKGLGDKTCIDVIRVMRDIGFNHWAERIETSQK